MKKNTKIRALAGMMALVLVVGTLAFFSKTMSIDNPFSTKAYGGETVEKFTPETDWEPGGEVNKEVQVKNTGDYDLFVRISFSEKWERNGQVITDTELSSIQNFSEFFPASADTSINGGSSVYKHLIGVENGTWINKPDGYFYYKTKVQPKETTTKLMDYVTLCKDADMGTYQESQMRYALVDADKNAEDLTDADYSLDTAPSVVPEGKVLYQKKVISLDENNAGLAGAKYTLTIITQIVQADADAAAGWSYTPSN